MSSVVPLSILVALLGLLTLVVLVVVVLVVVRASAQQSAQPSVQPSAGAPQRPAPLPGGTSADERLRVEASAIMATSGWHTAESFLREQRGLTPEAARALLDSLA